MAHTLALEFVRRWTGVWSGVDHRIKYVSGNSTIDTIFQPSGQYMLVYIRDDVRRGAGFSIGAIVPNMANPPIKRFPPHDGGRVDIEEVDRLLIHVYHLLHDRRLI
jgi:hypothetical protein